MRSPVPASLLLVNYRPEYRHEWGSRTHYTQLRLHPLGRESSDEMLSELLSISKARPDTQPIAAPDTLSFARSAAGKGRVRVLIRVRVLNGMRVLISPRLKA
jgi:hypothetical protein